MVLLEVQKKIRQQKPEGRKEKKRKLKILSKCAVFYYKTLRFIKEQ